MDVCTQPLMLGLNGNGLYWYWNGLVASPKGQPKREELQASIVRANSLSFHCSVGLLGVPFQPQDMFSIMIGDLGWGFGGSMKTRGSYSKARTNSEETVQYSQAISKGTVQASVNSLCNPPWVLKDPGISSSNSFCSVGERLNTPQKSAQISTSHVIKVHKWRLVRQMIRRFALVMVSSWGRARKGT